MASTARRLPTEYALPILAALTKHPEDAADPHLPLMIWWGYEAHAGAGPASSPQLGVPLPAIGSPAAPRTQLLEALAAPEAWEEPLMAETVLPRLMQRLALEGVTHTASGSASAATSLDTCATLLQLAPDDTHRGRLLAGFLEAYQGRDVESLPPPWPRRSVSTSPASATRISRLALKLGQPDAVTQALAVVNDEAADAATRLAYMDLLGHAGKPEVIGPLLGRLGSSSPAIKRGAMLALLNYDDPTIGQTICSRYHSSLPAEHDLRSTAQRVLASRAVWTRQFLTEFDEFRIKPATVPLDVVQQMRLHADPDIQQRLDKHWGRTRATPEEKQQQIARVRTLLATAGDASNPATGRELFKKHCATCHTLFDAGGQTGPKLTGYERDNLDFIVPAVIDPSAAIREEFTQFQVVTHDGLALNGLLDNQTATTVTLRGANNQTTLLNRDDIEVLKAVETSLMPEGVIEKLSDAEVRDLFAYLTRRTPLPAAGP